MADRETNPLVEQIRRGGVPLDVRMMAAEGALPLKPEDLIDLLELMHKDPVAEVASLATKTFTELDIDTLLPAAGASAGCVFTDLPPFRRPFPFLGEASVDFGVAIWSFPTACR